jgi:hypothetical protein
MTTLEIVLLILVIYLLVGIFSILIPIIKEGLFEPDTSYKKNNCNITAACTVIFIFLWPITYTGIIVQWITEQYNRLY